MRAKLSGTIVIATNNHGKLREIRDVFAAYALEVVAAGTLVPGWTIAETGATFAENACLKAIDLARRCGVAALADDSGLEVDALAGRPGVRSARYAGEAASDSANVVKLLDELRHATPRARRAAFRCALALAWPDGALVEVEGRCEGTIAFTPRGFRGFGYDPVFVDPATGLTFAELPEHLKGDRSHRGRALAALCTKLGMR